MHAVPSGERTLTDLDYSRLDRLLDRQFVPALADLLAHAEVESSRAIDERVVTMYSQFELLDLDTDRRQTLTICYPGDAQPLAGFISVLSPVGLSVLGLKAGDVARRQAPNGEVCLSRVAAVLFQPEATGDYIT